jgi:cell division septal protein FtsQ
MKPQRPAVAQPDQRYWRARANRRVRKARYTRNLVRWTVILLVNAAFFGALFFIGARGMKRVTSSKQFALHHVELQGVQRASAEAIRGRVAPAMGSNLFDLELEQVARRVREDPWVRDVSVRRVLPRTLRVSVVEREPAALAVINGVVHVVDPTGHVIGPVGSRPIDDLPVLTGLEQMTDPELVQALRDGVGLVERLRQRASVFFSQVSELDLSRADRVTARMVQRGPLILLDPQRVERNVPQFLALREVIAQRAGEIEYVDLRWQDRITVKPIETSSRDQG